MGSGFDIRIGAESFACGHDCPADPCQLVGEGYGYQPLRLPGTQRVDPVGESAFALACDTQHRSRARDEHFADVTVALFGDCAEPLLAAARVLPGRQTKPRREVAPGLEHPRIGNAGGNAAAWNAKP